MIVAIVGGGPAGLLSAILLARKGFQVEIFDKGEWPIDKVCGEGLMPIGVNLLEKYDLLKFIDKNKARNFKGITYINNDGKRASGHFIGRSGKVIRRLALSQGLYDAAKLESNIKLNSKTEFLSYEENDFNVNLKVKTIEDQQVVSLSGFDYLIGADGLKSKVRSISDLQGQRFKIQPNRMGARVHVEMEPWDENVQVWWQDGIECYVAPSSNNCVEFNFGWDHDVIKPQRIPGKNLEEGLFSFFPNLREKALGFKRVSQMRSWGPLPHKALHLQKGRVALIGDAAFFYDQITGEGISLAFVQAEILAKTIKDWNTIEGRETFLYEIDKVANHYFQVTALAMFFTRHPKLRSLMIWLLGRSPELFSHLLHTNMGEYSLYKIPMKYILKGLFCPKKT